MSVEPAATETVPAFRENCNSPCDNITGPPVHVVEPNRTQGRLREFLRVLGGQERIRAFAPALEPFEVTPLRETARVAAEIRLRLGL